MQKVRSRNKEVEEIRAAFAEMAKRFQKKNSTLEHRIILGSQLREALPLNEKQSLREDQGVKQMKISMKKLLQRNIDNNLVAVALE